MNRRPHRRASQRTADPRDAELARVLRDADAVARPSDAELRAFSARIIHAATPMLDARSAAERTVWDYAERWSAVLLPVGALTAVAAGVCLFALANSSEPVSPRASTTRVALAGAATNRVSSQNLLDLLVAGDAAVTSGNRDER